MCSHRANYGHYFNTSRQFPCIYIIFHYDRETKSLDCYKECIEEDYSHFFWILLNCGCLQNPKPHQRYTVVINVKIHLQAYSFHVMSHNCGLNEMLSMVEYSSTSAGKSYLHRVHPNIITNNDTRGSGYTGIDRAQL